MAGWVEKLFATIDRKDADGFVGFLTEDASFRFGNAPPAVGRKDVREGVAGFFDTFESLRHEVVGVWETDGVVTCEVRVVYTRKDGGVVDLPCANIFRMKDGLIRDYRIFIDISPLYA